MKYEKTRRNVLQFASTALGLTTVQTVQANDGDEYGLNDNPPSPDVRISNNSNETLEVRLKIYDLQNKGRERAIARKELPGLNQHDKEGVNHVYEGELRYVGNGEYYTLEAELSNGETADTKVPITPQGLPNLLSVTVHINNQGKTMIGTLHE